MINTERLVKTFCDLAQIDSPSGEEDAIAEDLLQRLGSLGIDAKRDTHGNVVAHEDGPTPLLLSAHMDTVEPGRGVKPREEAGQIVSDGTTILGGDCKAGLTAILEALTSIQEENTSRKPIEIAFTRGEELGLVGARNLEFSTFKSKECIVFDGEGPPNRITSGTPTYIGFDIRIQGKAAHAGVEPENGISSIQAAADIIAALPQGRLDDDTTFNTAIIEGGSVRNAVPENTIVKGEFRSRNAESLALARKQFEAAIEKTKASFPEATISHSLNTEFEMYNISDNEPVLQQIQKGLKAIGLEPELEPTGGGQDANILRENGINAIAVGMSSHNAHTVREYVEISELVNAAKLCEQMLLSN
ncbi:MAG: M20/M25/M40 family metallo-hydrolase [SAR202 cluster bacterium]|nr:M20/M25/M40 family metallo-hydrolase [SAR202 cluster bacterium]|tara:strand:- start:2224 stop:3303 length:1080 start_codon:yes stop_codon:yes gene_type:complete